MPITTIDRDAIADLARRVVSARVDGDSPALRELLHPDVSLRVLGEPAAVYPFPTVRDGIDEVIKAFAALHAMCGCVEYVMLKLIVDNDRVVLLRRMELVHRFTGQSATVHVSNWLRFRDGRVIEILQLADNAAMMKLLGLD